MDNRGGTTRLLAARDVRERLGGISRSTLYRYIKAGYLPAPVRSIGPGAGRPLSFVAAEIEEFMRRTVADRGGAHVL